MKRAVLILATGLAMVGLSSCFCFDYCGPIGPPHYYHGHGYYDHGYYYGGGYDCDYGVAYDIGYDLCW
jgi:hypothetical protein